MFKLKNMMQLRSGKIIGLKKVTFWLDDTTDYHKIIEQYKKYEERKDIERKEIERKERFAEKRKLRERL